MNVSTGNITIDGEVIPVSDLDFCSWGNPLINEDVEDKFPDFLKPMEITITLPMSRKSIKRLRAFLNSSLYKPARLRSAIGLKRRRVKHHE